MNRIVIGIALLMAMPAQAVIFKAAAVAGRNMLSNNKRSSPFPWKEGETHQKARTEHPKGYVLRQALSDDEVPWHVDVPGYSPKAHEDPVLKLFDETVKKGGWADPADFKLVVRKLVSYTGKVLFGPDRLPRNPAGRTGLKGRGLLGRWGANFAGDPIVTRLDPATGQLQLLIIQRGDNGQWALPGGMVDPGEKGYETISRELFEETGVKIDFKRATSVYRGYVDDPRNTDNAWIETFAKHKHLSAKQAATVVLKEAGGEAKALKFEALTPELLGRLYASHGDLVRRSMAKFIQSGKAPAHVVDQWKGAVANVL
jgi:ADP-ribose pyrophosphatase